MNPRTKFHIECNNSWASMLRGTVGSTWPTTAVWTDLSQAVKVLANVAETGQHNHMFFPKSGGNDLYEVRQSPTEGGCIDLKSSSWSRLKFDALHFFSLCRSPHWSFFLLQGATLEPSGLYDDAPEWGEEVVERGDGTGFSNRDLWSVGHDENGHDFPQGSHTLTRYFTGSIAIFSKGSFYNIEVSRAYSGLHNQESPEVFIDFLQALRASSGDQPW